MSHPIKLLRKIAVKAEALISFNGFGSYVSQESS